MGSHYSVDWTIGLTFDIFYLTFQHNGRARVKATYFGNKKPLRGRERGLAYFDVPVARPSCLAILSSPFWNEANGYS